MDLVELLRNMPPAFTWLVAGMFVASQLGIALILGKQVGKNLFKLQLPIVRFAPVEI